MILPQMQNANRINFLWVYTESLFAIVTAISAVGLCRLLTPSAVRDKRSRMVRASAG
jgi:hypothetical protein